MFDELYQRNRRTAASQEIRAWLTTLTHIAVSGCVAYATLRSVDIDPLAPLGAAWREWRQRQQRLAEPANPLRLERMRERVQSGEFTEFPNEEKEHEL